MLIYSAHFEILYTFWLIMFLFQATASAVAEATNRIQELQSQTRQQYTGIELEVRCTFTEIIH